jgi:hypothetical protein
MQLDYKVILQHRLITRLLLYHHISSITREHRYTTRSLTTSNHPHIIFTIPKFTCKNEHPPETQLRNILSYFKIIIHNAIPQNQRHVRTYLLFKLALYTWDCICGLNERKLAFVQLCAWYAVLKQAIYIARLFLLGNNIKPTVRLVERR